MHFSLVIIRPFEKNPYYQLEDAVFPLFFALKRLGFDVEILINKVNEQSQNIIFGSCSIPQEISPYLPKNSIIYNLESMVPNGKLSNVEYLTHLKKFEVWDYSQTNIAHLKEKDINATYAPLGYVPEMSRLKHKKEPGINLLYYGPKSSDDCQKPILKLLKDMGIGFHIAKGVNGTKRDTLIYRSKAVLNLHEYFIPAILEELKLGYLWANKVPVLSEVRDTIIPNHLREACLFARQDELLEVAKSFTSNKKALSVQANKGFLAFASKPLELSLKQLVGEKLYPVSSCTPERIVPINIPSLRSPAKDSLLSTVIPPKINLIKILKNSFRKNMTSAKKKKEESADTKEKEIIYNGTGPKQWTIKNDLLEE